MKYKVLLTELKLNANLGIHDFEKQNPQQILVDVTLFISTQDDADDIQSTVDYDFLRTTIKDIVNQKHINLQETLVLEIARACMEADILGVTVYARKTQVYDDCKSVGVELSMGEIW